MEKDKKIYVLMRMYLWLDRRDQVRSLGDNV